MAFPEIVTREKWLEARKQFLAREKQATRERARQRPLGRPDPVSHRARRRGGRSPAAIAADH